ncbi:MAG: hypothetical protein JSR45_06995 [Proteobacteria bacterium]|nr:hypothetical protein [Pseudomonadota bacterium]
MTIGLPHKTELGKTALIALAIGCAALVSGCASFAGKTDTTSSAAASVTRVEHMDLPYPRWSQFPAAPTNVPTPAAVSTEAKAVEADQVQLLGEASQLQWTLCCTDAWAAQARSAIDPAMAVQAPPDAEAQTEAFAKAMREAATPPAQAPK